MKGKICLCYKQGRGGPVPKSRPCEISSECGGESTGHKNTEQFQPAKGSERIRNTLANIAEKEVRREKNRTSHKWERGLKLVMTQKRLSC